MRRPRGRVVAAALSLAAAGCGSEPASPSDRLELVGHSDLGGRGMNAALAVAGDTVYVGSRIDGAGRDAPVLIVDVADPAAPEVVGAIGPPDEGLEGLSSRELRVVPELDLLIVLNLQCGADLHGCSENLIDGENLRFYDISDRRAPVRIGNFPVAGGAIRPRSPHEFFLWQDPADDARVLLLMSAPPFSPSLEIVDVSDPTTPTRLVAWDPIASGAVPGPLGNDNILHSVSASPDGRTGYLSHLQGGLLAVDLGQVVDGVTPPVITALTPPEAIADWSPPSPVGPHSAVPVPGRDLLVVTDEVYPMPFGTGCPYGWMRLVDIADPAAPVVVSEHKLAENQAASCGAAETATTYSAHNATVTANLALVSWHSAGLQVVDLADPAAPRGLAEFRPEPLAEVAVEDPALGGNPVTMWSYPVVQDGLIYVVDIRNGLYILRYTGEHEAELLDLPGPLEGNSNLAWR